MTVLVLLAMMGATSPAPTSADAAATYHVKLLGLTPPKLAVTAELPIAGTALTMDTTRPAGVPELDTQGWPAFVSNLKVADATGRALEVTTAGPAGWTLDTPYTGRISVTYQLDYAALAVRGWPAAREAVLADGGNLSVVGRAIFITTHEVTASRVTFELSQGWQPATPWEPTAGSKRELSAGSAGELVENIIVLSRSSPDVVSAGGFRLLVTPMGHWEKARAEVKRVLGAVVPRLVGLMAVDERESYVVVLLPVVEHGGESYRHSFALTLEEPPSHTNSAVWGNTIAHEIFHVWNGWRLQAANYATSQWFQEGFTEYAANVSMVAGKLTTPDQFLQVLAAHIAKYRNLKTSMEAVGSHKGPPLYSAGALVAFTWDVRIRQATGGKSSLWDFMNALYRQTERGKQPYAWEDIQAALTATAPMDWELFHTSYIEGTEPLPLDETLAWAGLRLDKAKDGSPLIKVDSAAPPAAKTLWRALIVGH